MSLLTVPANMIHQYQVQLEGINAIPLAEPKQQHIGYEVGDCAQLKVPEWTVHVAI